MPEFGSLWPGLPDGLPAVLVEGFVAIGTSILIDSLVPAFETWVVQGFSVSAEGTAPGSLWASLYGPLGANIHSDQVGLNIPSFWASVGFEGAFIAYPTGTLVKMFGNIDNPSGALSAVAWGWKLKYAS
jgi:hypothetical protein